MMSWWSQDETVNVTLSAPTNASLGSPATALLTIIDDDLLPAAPIPDFAATPTTGNQPLMVSFTDQSTGTVTSWLWNFGDGNTSNQENPTHTYASAGLFTVALTVAGPGGDNTMAKPNFIEVKIPPPLAPILTAVSNDDQNGDYTVAWSTATHATSYQLQEQHNGAGWNTIYTGAERSRALTGKADGQWCYQVQASNSSGASPWSNLECTGVDSAPKPTLTLPANAVGGQGGSVTLPILFNSGGLELASLLFSINIDESKLGFDPTDTDNNCAPDGVRFSAALPASMVKCASYDGTDTVGEIDFTIADFSRNPRALSGGILVTLTLTVKPTAVVGSTAPVAFGLRSFGGRNGDVEGTVVNGAVLIAGAVATVEVSGASSQLTADGVSTSLMTATVRDADNRLLTNTLVRFSASSGVITPEAVTGSDGQALATYTAGLVAGPVTIRATSGSVSGETTVDLQPGPPVAIQIVSTVNPIIGDGVATLPILVSINDAAGNGIPGQQVSFTTTQGQVTAAATTDALGQASATLTAPKALGQATVTISAVRCARRCWSILSPERQQS